MPTEAHRMPVLEQIRLYPVKGLRGFSLAEAELERCGLAGDRRWLVTGPDQRFLTQRDLPAMATLDAIPDAAGLTLSGGGAACRVALPDAQAAVAEVVVWHHTLPARTAGPAADDWLSDRLGRPCRLWFMHDTTVRPVDAGFGQQQDRVSFADAFPILLVNSGSLAALNADLGDGAVPIDRFRPNLVVRGFPAWAENDWRTLRIGSMRFRVASPCARCVVITQDQRTGEKPDPGEPLRALGRLNRQPDGIMFGLNLIPEAPGRLSAGDAVEIDPNPPT